MFSRHTYILVALVSLTLMSCGGTDGGSSTHDDNGAADDQVVGENAFAVFSSGTDAMGELQIPSDEPLSFSVASRTGRTLDVETTATRIFRLEKPEDESTRLQVYERASLSSAGTIEPQVTDGSGDFHAIIPRGPREVWLVGHNPARLAVFEKTDDGEWERTDRIDEFPPNWRGAEVDWELGDGVISGRFLYVAAETNEADATLFVVDSHNRRLIDVDADSSNGTTPFPLEGTSPAEISVDREGRIGVVFSGAPEGDGAGIQWVDTGRFAVGSFLPAANGASLTTSARTFDGGLVVGRDSDAGLMTAAALSDTWGDDIQPTDASTPLHFAGLTATRDGGVGVTTSGRLVTWSADKQDQDPAPRLKQHETLPSDAVADRVWLVPRNPRWNPSYLRAETAQVSGEFDWETEKLWGPPEGGGGTKGSLDVVKDVRTMTIELTEETLVDGPGPDLVVFENVFDVNGNGFGRNVELGRLLLSEDGDTWHTYPTRTYPEFSAMNFRHYEGFVGVTPTYATAQNQLSPTSPAAGGDTFDLDEVELERARFIRIEAYAYDKLPPVSSAPDIDAVMLLNTAVSGEW